MPKLWTTLKRWQQYAAAIATIAGVLFGAFKLIERPILHFERQSVAITYLSNRVDEIAYKQDLILKEIQDVILKDSRQRRNVAGRPSYAP